MMITGTNPKSSNKSERSWLTLVSVDSISAMSVHDNIPLPNIMKKYSQHNKTINRLVRLANGDRWLVFDVFKDYVDDNGVLDYQGLYEYTIKMVYKL